jgi:DNA repair exonuclease SbcCD ATPase subunit
MAESIKKSDLLEGRPFEEIANEISGTLKVLTEYDAKIVSIAKHLKGDLKEANTQTLAGITSINTAEREAEKLAQEKLKTQQQQIKLSELERKALEAQAKATDKATKAEKDLNNAYKQLAKNTTDLKNQSKQLGAEMLNLEKAGRKNTEEYRKLESQYKAVTRAAQQGDAELKKLDATVGDNTRKVGSYTDVVDKLKNSLGALGLALGAGVIARDAFGVIVDFGNENARLAAILQKTQEETIGLQKVQRELAASSKFTAGEVASLQVELAKLGLTEEQIAVSTESVMNLALAAGSDLPTAASTAASTLRAFGFEASEMGRVVNVMAAGFTTTGLDISNFTESMKYVAPVAKSAGVSIEETTAMLGALADNGIKGSQAGTSLRRILTDMAMTGKPAQQALKEISDRGISLTDAFDEVGRTAQTSLLILSKNTDKISNLTEKYNDAEGVVDKMAETMGNTLGGSLFKLRSAFEEQILQMNDASSAGNTLKTSLEFLAQNIGVIFSLVVKVGRAWLLYKTTLIAVNTINKITTLGFKGIGNAILRNIPFTKQYTLAQKEAAIAAKQAGISAEQAGKKIGAVPWMIIATAVFELATALYDVASGARQAREDMERLNATADDATESLEKNITKILDEQKKRNEAIQNQLTAKKITQEESLKLQKASNQQTIDELRRNKELVIQRKNGYIADIIALKAVRKENKGFDEMQKKAAEIAKKYGIDPGKDILGFQKDAEYFDVLSQLEANVNGANIKIKGYTTAILDNKSALEANKAELQGLSKEEKDKPEKMREINTEFKRQNEYISEQTKLLKELRDIENQRLISQMDKNIDELLRLSVQATEQTGEIEHDLIEQMINDKYELEKEFAIEKRNFQIRELETTYQYEKYLRELKLKDEYEALIKGAKGNQQAIDTINANYKVEQENLKKEELERYADIEKRKVILTENSADEILKIEDNKQKEISEADDELIEAQIRFFDKKNDNIREQSKKELDEEKRLKDEKLKQAKELADELQRIEEGITEAVKDQIDNRISLLQKQADASAKQQEFLQNLAENGNIQANQSLKEQLEYQRDIQREMIRLEKQKQNVEAVSAGLKVFLSEVEAGKNPTQAIASAFVSTGVLVNMLKGLAFFEKGTMNAPEGLAVVDEKGSELITDKKGNIKELGTNKGARLTYLNQGDKVYTATQTAGIFDQMQTASNVKGKQSNTTDLKVLQNGLKAIETTIKNKPELNIHWDLLGAVERRKANGVTTINRFVNR